MQSSGFTHSPSQQANESVVNEDEEELLQDRADLKMGNDTGAGAGASADAGADADADADAGTSINFRESQGFLDPVSTQERFTSRAPRTMMASSHGTHTNSGSHETVTASDLPRTTRTKRDLLTLSQPQSREADVSRVPVPAAASVPARHSAKVRPRSSAWRDHSYVSSDRGGAAPSITSAQDSRSAHMGPMGRYTSSISGRSSLFQGARPRPTAAAAAAAAAAATPIPADTETVSAPPPTTYHTPHAKPTAELDQTLRAIQASLTALTERLDRTESSMAQPQRQASLTRILLHHTMAATHATLQDIGACLGLIAQPNDTLAPSYEAWRLHGATGSRAYSLWPLLRSPFKFASIVVGLALRILLDMSSLFVLASLLIAALRRLSGRGDPWIAWRLLGRLSARVAFLSRAANRRAFLRTLLAGVLLGGVTMESTRRISQ